MPKITIKTLPLDSAIDIPDVLMKLGIDLEQALDIGPDRLAILWEPILARHFLFNGRVTNVQEKSTHHPIVEVTAVKGMPDDLEQQMVRTIARNLSCALKVDYTNICVTVNTLAPGKLFVSGEFKMQPVKKRQVL